MKGILPWLIEALFGPIAPNCKSYGCDYEAMPECVSKACAYHCRRDCKCGAAPSHEMNGLAYKAAGKRKTRNQFDWPEDLNI